MQFKICIILFLLFTCYNLRSQTDSSENFTLPETKIYQKVNNKEKIYKFDEDANRFILRDTLLIADTNVYKYKVSLNDISKISFRNGTHFWGAAAGVGAFGFILGFFTGAYFNFGDGTPKFNFTNGLAGGVLFAIPAALIGGLFGLLSPHYDEYNVYNAKESRYNRLIKIFRQNRL